MTNLEQITLLDTASVQQVLLAIDRGAVQIVLIVDTNGCLVGTVTDGDIRRGLLNGASLDQPVAQLMNRQFKAIHSSDNREAALLIMREQQLLQIPVLDNQGQPIEILLLQDLLRPLTLPNSVVIMAGGKGTRLRPQTEFCPKPMLIINDKPILEILLDQCIASGFRHFYLSVNYLKEKIIDYFQDGSRWNVKIEYLMEDKPLGTAGSMQLLPASVQLPFLVINGDVLTRFNLNHLLRFHSENGAQATVCVREHELTVPFGVVQNKGLELAGFEEKPTYRHLVNAGIYVINPELLPLIPPNQFTDMPSLLNFAQKAGYNVLVCPIHEYWIDVGQPDNLSTVRSDWI